MFSFVSSLALSLLLATTVLAQTYTINTPFVDHPQPADQTLILFPPAVPVWSFANLPYLRGKEESLPISCVLPAGQPSAPPLVDLGKQTGTSITWTVNLGAGTAVFLNLRDSTGTLAQSGQFTIISGSNTTCIGKDIVTSAGPSVAGTVASATVSSGTKPSASGSSAASASASASKSAAVSQYAPVGLAVFAGAAVLALMA